MYNNLSNSGVKVLLSHCNYTIAKKLPLSLPNLSTLSTVFYCIYSIPRLWIVKPNADKIPSIDHLVTDFM